MTSLYQRERQRKRKTHELEINDLGDLFLEKMHSILFIKCDRSIRIFLIVFVLERCL